MKWIRRIIIWSIAALLLQGALFYVINKTYFGTEATFKEVKVVHKKEEPSIKIHVPDQAQEITASYNGKYISFFENSTLKVMNITDGVMKSVNPESNGEVCYCKWLPDSNIAIVVERVKEGTKKQYLKFFSYDASKDNKKEIIDFHNKELSIGMLGIKDSIGDIALSTLTHTMYIKVLRGGIRNDIYRVNVMNEIEKLKCSGYRAGNIAVLATSDNFIYEDQISGTIRLFDKNTSLKYDGVKKQSLLYTNREENIYIGVGSENKIEQILYGKDDVPVKEWTTIDLPQPVEKEDIIFHGEGQVYVNSALEGSIMDLQSMEKTKYNGAFIGLRNDSIISVYDHCVLKTPIKKEGK